MHRPLSLSIRAAAALFVLTLALPALARPGGDDDRGDGPWPQQECLSGAGKTACGYDCVSAYGDVLCASVPWGACKAAYGKIWCGPENTRLDRRAQRRWRRIPKAECVSGHGSVACGWGCVIGSGGPACSPAPGGVCESAYGKTECSAAGAVNGVTPECKAAYGEIACGFGCVAAYGEVRCAKYPDGVCAESYGKVVCSDGGGGRRAPQQECKSAYGKTACGYSCVAAYGDVRCASDPSGRCVAAHGTITCSD
ncbi:MAG: hypothetical protein EP329_07250 [Deltaproteobacteria bacterium]|nr:MAG: hypothetical protein EP329_07250 [Deltaproteobacteria bacterium]